MPIRIVVAGDHPIMRTGIVAILGRDPYLTVIAETADSPQTVTVCGQACPAVVLLALHQPRLANLQVTRLLIAEPQPPRILCLGEQADVTALHETLSAGASGYLLTTVTGAELVAAVHQVLAGRQVVPGSGSALHTTANPLGSQERIILRLVAKGLPNKAIAQQQGLSERTVANHLQSVFRKLQVSNRTDAVARAWQEGFLPVE